MDKSTTPPRSYIVVSGIFLLLELIMLGLGWRHLDVVVEPRLRGQAEARAEIFGRTLIQGRTFQLEQILTSTTENTRQRISIENLLDELFSVKALGESGEFLIGIKLTLAPHIADKLEIVRGKSDCQSCFKIDDIPLQSPATNILIGSANLLIDPSYYQTLEDEVHADLSGFAILGTLILGGAWLLLMLLFRELHRLKEQAESAGRAKTRFLANVSHELRTPLNAILGYTQLFKQDEQLMKAYAQAIDTIHRSGEHLLGLINDVLDFAKAETVRLELVEENFELPKFLQSLAEMTRIRTQFKDIQFVYNAPVDLPEVVRADHKRLRQVLLNLLGNAVKFTDAGQVEFHVETTGIRPGFQTLRFCVDDTGCGIPKSDQSRIFLPFQQVSGSKSSAEGTGLGLTISRHLLELMNSRLQFTSDAGKGSHFCFELELPVTSSMPQATEPVISGYRGALRTLLVVDDNAFNRLVLRQLVRRFGFDSKECNSGTTCLDFLASGKKPDLVLLDLMMPDMDGFETVRRIRANPDWRELPVIAVSAAAGPEMEERALTSGCSEFLNKPVQVRDLLDCLHRHLELEWDYQDMPLPQDEFIESGITLPPGDVLQTLQNCARQHNISGLHKVLAELEQDEQYQKFSSKLGVLIAQFQFKQLIEFIDELPEKDHEKI